MDVLFLFFFFFFFAMNLLKWFLLGSAILIIVGKSVKIINLLRHAHKLQLPINCSFPPPTVAIEVNSIRHRGEICPRTPITLEQPLMAYAIDGYRDRNTDTTYVWISKLFWT